MIANILTGPLNNFYGVLKGVLGKIAEKIVRHFVRISFFAYIARRTSIYGLNHVTNREYTILERLLWLTLTLVFAYFSCDICVSQAYRFVTNPFVLFPETDHLSWSYHLPTITICSDYVYDNFIDEFYQRFETGAIDRNSKTYRDYYNSMKIIANLNAGNIGSVERFERDELFRNFSGEELLDMAIKMKFRNESIDFYRPVVTEVGLCYSRMEIYKHFEAMEKVPNYNKTNPEWTLEWRECKTYSHCSFGFYNYYPGTTFKLYFHGFNETPSLKISPQTAWTPPSGGRYLAIIQQEIASTDRIKLFGIETRKCRFDSETTSDHGYLHGPYTQNLCLMECSVDAAIRICGCRPFFYKLGLGPICNISGLYVVLLLNTLSLFVKNILGFVCQRTIGTIFVKTVPAIQIAILFIIPSIKRDLMFGIHFLVVSIGGAAALFLGCSIISVADLTYFSAKYFYETRLKKRIVTDHFIRETVDSNQSSKQLTYFVQNSTLHGIRFLDARYGMVDRIVLFGIFIASVVAMVGISILTLYDYLDVETIANFEAMDSQKNNTFPAVAVCVEKDHSNDATFDKRVLNFIEKYYDDHKIEIKNYKKFYAHLLDYAYYNPSSPNFKYALYACEANNSTCGVNIETIKPLLFPYCDELIYNIRFNGRHYPNCSDIFKRILVYSEGVYTFSPDELPSIRYMLHYSLYDHTDIEIMVKTTETENSKDVRDLSIEKRKCRFPDERQPQHASLPYSFVSCLIYNRVRLDLELCNCTLHFAPREFKHQYCNYEQMKCIAQHDTRRLILYSYKYFELCVSTCTEMHVDFVGYFRQKKVTPYKRLSNSDPVKANATVTIQAVNQPTRLSRKLSFTNVDQVVALGSIVGLFFGASFLSLVEIIYCSMFRRA